MSECRVFVTILEESVPAAVDAVRALPSDHDGVEIRAERFPADADLYALRRATTKPLLLTFRGKAIDDATIARALDFGIDLVDVEWRGQSSVPFRDRVVLSHHDYDGVPDDLESLAERMLALGCAETKIAVTPRNFAENERLLRTLRDGLTLFGMGERGLYSRILAPFFGSRLSFVAPDEEHLGAPGQLTLERGLAIYGNRKLPPNPRVFAVAGNPAGHSLSPSIHNTLFRERGVAAAYTIASVESFDEIAEAFQRGKPCGLSITAPFKEDAYRFACTIGAELRENARRAEAINTLVKTPRGVFADNTDVDGFLDLIPSDVERVSIAGAGGTARAAIVALQMRGIPFEVFNRTPRTILGHDTKPLDAIGSGFIIDTLPGHVAIDFQPSLSAAYNRGGLRLLHAQAMRQNELFLEVFR